MLRPFQRVFDSVLRSAARSVSGGREGVWLGGTATLYADRLEFQPNSLNTAFHGIATRRIILLANVVDVQEHRSVGSNIIDVTDHMGTFSLRCFGAGEFAQAIRSALAHSARR